MNTVPPIAHYLEHARHLHETSIVFDSMSPRITSEWVITPEMVELGRTLQAQGNKRYAIQAAFQEYTLQHAERDATFRTAYLDYWRRSGVTAVSSTLYASGSPEDAWETTLVRFALAGRLVNAFGGEIVQAGWAADVEAAHARRKLAVVFNLQNAEPLGSKLDRVDTLRSMGLRSMQLTYNLRTRFGDGCLEDHDGGLSRLGVSLIEKLNASRIMVDVSHASHHTAADTVTASKMPVVASHTAVHAISGHARALPDDVLKSIASKGGYIGVAIVPAFVRVPGDERAAAHGKPLEWGTLDAVSDHVAHLVNLVGEDHVGIGSDFGKPYYNALPWTAEQVREASGGAFDWVGWKPGKTVNFNAQCAGMETWDQWPNLTATLLARGFGEATIRKIIGANFLRAFRDICG